MVQKVTALLTGILVLTVVLGGAAPLLQFSTPATAAPAADIVVNDEASATGTPPGSCATPVYNSIQNAIDNATDGDKIKVCQGTYDGANVTKNVTIVGTAGAVIEEDPDGDFGLNVSASTVEIRNLTISNFTSAGVFIKPSTSSTQDITVTGNQIINNGDGVRLAQNTNPADIRIVRNVISENTRGINNLNQSADVTAWLNYWGSTTGPSSGLQDPKTNATATGSGDNVSESGVNGVSNVQFDPWIGKEACSDDGQLTSLIESDVLSNVTRACAWDRALLPLRADNADAATSVSNMAVFLNGSGISGDVPANRDHLELYNEGSSVTLQFQDVPGQANTDRFADTDSDDYAEDDVQLLVLGGASRPEDIAFGFNQSTGHLEIAPNASTVNITNPGQLDADGDLTTEYQLGSDRQYTFVLVRKKFGEGLAQTADGNVTVDGGIDVLGVESIQTQDTVATAQVNGPITAGNNATFQVDSNLGSTGTTNHSVLIYHRNTFTGGQTTIGVDTNLSSVLTGGASTNDVTLYPSINEVNGIYRLQNSLNLFGVTVPAFTEQGTIPVSTLTSLDVQPTGTTQLDSSATGISSSSNTATIDVETFQNNFSTGTYQYIYVAESGSDRATTAGTFTLNPVPPSEGGTAPPGGGGGGSGGGGGGGGAPDRGDQDDDSVRVVNASLSNTTIEPGSSVTVSAVVQNDRQSAARFTATLYVDDAEVRSKTITIDPQSTETVTFTRTFSDEGEYDIRVNDVEAGTLTVSAATETPTTIEPRTETNTPPGEGPPGTDEMPGPGEPDGDGLPWVLIAIGVLIILAALVGAYYLFVVQG